MVTYEVLSDNMVKSNKNSRYSKCFISRQFIKKEKVVCFSIISRSSCVNRMIHQLISQIVRFDSRTPELSITAYFGIIQCFILNCQVFVYSQNYLLLLKNTLKIYTRIKFAQEPPLISLKKDLLIRTLSPKIRLSDKNFF